MANDNLRNLLADLPEVYRAKIAVIKNETHLVISEDCKAVPVVTSFVLDSLLFGIEDFEFVPPSVFDARYAKFTSRVSVGENAIQQLAIDMIADAFHSGATDIHIANFGTYGQAKFRILGMLRQYSEYDPETIDRMIRSIYEHMGAAQDAPAFDNVSRLDGRIVSRDYLPPGLYSVRMHIEPIEAEAVSSGKGSFMALRLMYDTTGASGTLEERLTRLGYTDKPVEIVLPGQPTRIAIPQTEFFRQLASRSGIVFISGPTGSGKSTALSHCMEALIEERPTDNFLSIEDPPEKPIRGMYQIPVISKDEANRGRAYTDAIAGTNRDDPDTVMIGEIRYAEAAVATLDVALSGNSVWTTIHAPDAIGIIRRLAVMLREEFPEPLETVCDPLILSGLVFQRLCPMLCPHCKISIKDKPLRSDILRRLERTIPYGMLMGDNTYDGLFVRNHEGCPHCKSSGHPGLSKQTVISEVCMVDPGLLELLKAHRFSAARHYWLKELNGMSFFEHARHLLVRGVIDPMICEEMLACGIDSDLDADEKLSRAVAMKSDEEDLAKGYAA